MRADPLVVAARRPLIEGERRLEARVDPRRQVVQRRAQGVEIGAGVGDAAILLRRGVALGPDHRPALLILEGAGDAEVDQHQRAILPDHDVGGLEVAEDDRVGGLAVQVAQHVAELHAPVDQLRLQEAVVVLLDQRLQVLPGDELLHQVIAAALGEIVEDLGDQRVREDGEQPRLALEVRRPLLAQRLVAAAVEHLLDGADALDVGEAEVERLVDGAHPARAEGRGDAVAPLEDRAGRDRHLPSGAARRRALRAVRRAARAAPRRGRRFRHGIPVHPLLENQGGLLTASGRSGRTSDQSVRSGRIEGPARRRSGGRVRQGGWSDRAPVALTLDYRRLALRRTDEGHRP